MKPQLVAFAISLIPSSRFGGDGTNRRRDGVMRYLASL
jgi:hypothetical protein